MLNTQSYVWDFGADTDTMLKVHQGSAYIFAGIGLSQSPGVKTFTVPPGLPASGTVEVIGENRTIPYSNGRFTDSFGAEFTHHKYRIKM